MNKSSVHHQLPSANGKLMALVAVIAVKAHTSRWVTASLSSIQRSRRIPSSSSKSSSVCKWSLLRSPLERRWSHSGVPLVLLMAQRRLHPLTERPYIPSTEHQYATHSHRLSLYLVIVIVFICFIIDFFIQTFLLALFTQKVWIYWNIKIDFTLTWSWSSLLPWVWRQAWYNLMYGRICMCKDMMKGIHVQSYGVR